MDGNAEQRIKRLVLMISNMNLPISSWFSSHSYLGFDFCSNTPTPTPHTRAYTIIISFRISNQVNQDDQYSLDENLRFVSFGHVALFEYKILFIPYEFNAFSRNVQNYPKCPIALEYIHRSHQLIFNVYIHLMEQWIDEHWAPNSKICPCVMSNAIK